MGWCSGVGRVGWCSGVDWAGSMVDWVRKVHGVHVDVAHRCPLLKTMHHQGQKFPRPLQKDKIGLHANQCL